MTWVLLRGLTREARHWGGFAGQLEAHFDEPVLTPDLPGSGAFFGGTSPASVHGMLEAVRGQLFAGGAQPPFDVLGLSMGGMLAAEWAQRYPHEVSRLVLVNTSMRPFSRITQRLRPENWAAIARIALRWPRRTQAEAIEDTIYGLTCRQANSRDADVALWSAIRRSAPVSAGNAARQLYAAARFSCARTAPPCPVLVLSSTHDQLVDPSCSAQLANAWQAAHQRHNGAGHDLPHDDGHWMCRQMSMWMASGQAH